jgi:hypothetical protein
MSHLSGIRHSVQALVEENANLFVAFALLNATGYHAENGLSFSLARREIRLKLASSGNYWLSRLEGMGLSASLHRAGGAILMDHVPLFPGPFCFERSREVLRYATKWQRDSLGALTGVEGLLQEFSDKEHLSKMWAGQEAARASAAALLHSLAEPLTRLAARFGEPTTSRTMRVFLWPNLLDAQNRGYSLSSSDCTWLFLGPFQDPATAEATATHELLHRWADPEAEHEVTLMGGKDPMPEARAEFRIVAEAYSDLSIWISEIVVRAITAWLLPRYTEQHHKSAVSYLEQSELQGMVGITAAYNHFCTSPEKPLPALVKDAVQLVHGRVFRH